MSQAKTKNKVTFNSTKSFQKKPLEVAVGAAVMVLCASAQAATYTSGVSVERLDHEVINFARTYTDLFGRIDVVVAGNGGSGSNGSSASSAASGTAGTPGTTGTSASSQSGSRTIERIHTPEQTANSALVSVNTISNVLSINGILLDAKVAPDANTANSTLTVSASTSATGGVGGIGGAGGAGAGSHNYNGGAGGPGGTGGAATGGAVIVNGDLQRVYTANATVSDNVVTNAVAGVITTSGGNRAGIGLQSVNDVTMVVTTKATASTYAEGGSGGSGGVGGPGGSAGGGGNGSDGGAGGPGGTGGSATAGNATATVDSRATISLTSTVASNAVTNAGTITANLDGIGLQALALGDGRAYGAAIAESDAVLGSAGSVGTAGNTGSPSENGGGAAGAAGSGGNATLGTVIANADAQASVTTVARLLDNQVANSGIVTATTGTGINLIADAQSRATTSSLAVRSSDHTTLALDSTTHSAGTYLGTHDSESAFNVLTGNAQSSLLRNTITNSGQITAAIDGVAVVGTALSTISTNNSQAYGLASEFVSSSDVYQAADGTSYAAATVQSNTVNNSETISARNVGVNIYADADSLVNAGTSLSSYDLVRGSSQAISDASSNAITNNGVVYVDLLSTGTVGYGLSVRSNSRNETNIGGIDAAQKATALVSSNTITNQNDLYVRSNSANNTGTTLVGINLAADATNTGRSKITGSGNDASSLANWSITGSTAQLSTPPSLDDLNTSARVNSNTVSNTDLISLEPFSRTGVTSSAILLAAQATSNPNVYVESTLSTGSNPMDTEGVRTTVNSNTVSSTGTISAGGANVYGVRLLSSSNMNTPNSGSLDLSISSATASSNILTTGGSISLTAVGTNSVASGVQVESQSVTTFGGTTNSRTSGAAVREVYAASASSGNTIANSAAITATATGTGSVASGLMISANTNVDFGDRNQTTDDLVVTSAAEGNTITQTSAGSVNATAETVHGVVVRSTAIVSGTATLNGASADVRLVTANTNQNTISIGGTLSVTGVASQGGIGLLATASNNLVEGGSDSAGVVQAYVGKDADVNSGNSVTNSSTMTVSNGHGVWLKADARSSSTLNATTTAEVSRNILNNTGSISVAGSSNDAIRLEAIAQVNTTPTATTGATQILRNSITNSGSITSSSADDVIEMIASTIDYNTITNSGTLTAGNDVIHIDSVASASNNTVTNLSTGVVTGPDDFLDISGSVVSTNTIDNRGVVALGDDFVDIAGATVSSNTILNSGRVTVDSNFVEIDSGSTTTSATTINNSGLVTAGNDFVNMDASSSISNTAITNSGSITVVDDFIQIESPTISGTAVTNSGVVTAGDFGVYLEGATSITGSTILNSGSSYTGDTFVRLNGSTAVTSNSITNSGLAISGDYGIYLNATTLTGNTIVNSGRLISKNDGINLTGTTTDNNTVTVSGVLITDKGLTLSGSTLTRSNQSAWSFTSSIEDAIFISSGSGEISNTLNISAPAYLAGNIRLQDMANVNVNLTSGPSHSTRWAFLGEDNGGPTYRMRDQDSSYVWSGDTTTRAALSGVVPWFVKEGGEDIRTADTFASSGYVYDVYATIDPTAFTAAVNQAGDLSSSVSTMMNQGMIANVDRQHSLWIGAIGHRLDYDGDRRATNDQKTSLGSYALGYTYRYNPDWLLGAMIGSSDSTLKVSSQYADLYSNSFDNKARGEFLSLNVGTRLQGIDVNLGLSGGSQRHEDRRFVNDNLEWWGVSYASSKYTSKWLAPEITLAYPWTIETGLVLKPNVNVRYTNQKIGSYTETGSASNATVQGRTLGITDTTVGFDLTKTYGKSSLTGRLSYVNRSSDEQDVVRVTMLDDTRNVPTFYKKFDAVRAGFIWKLNLASDLDLFVNANYLSGSDVKGADGNVALRLQF